MWPLALLAAGVALANLRCGSEEAVETPPNNPDPQYSRDVATYTSSENCGPIANRFLNIPTCGTSSAQGTVSNHNATLYIPPPAQAAQLRSLVQNGQCQVECSWQLRPLSSFEIYSCKARVTTTPQTAPGTSQVLDVSEASVRQYCGINAR